ncbi:hypothetical protein LOD99_9242 [Oopsacas minuta]|uniref:Uncharacterized protein n=1 Tax=Oopsacas minuta TaxID=111878 RepID=A0AAV7JCG9_9METZ|nr:hypothetical protein LOD99_9242 [Oopsacas minuta]
MIEIDSILNEHIRWLAAAEQKKISSAGVVERGNMIPWLSRTTMENIPTVFVNAIQKRVVARLKKDGVFSIQLDSTTDVAIMDQLCLVIGATSLIMVNDCKDTSGTATGALLACVHVVYNFSQWVQETRDVLSCPGCRSNYLGEDKSTSIFNFPKDVRLRELWFKAIPRPRKDYEDKIYEGMHGPFQRR